MAYSKVTFNGTTIMDVTSDTVAANNLLTGETATKADGTKVTGTYSPTVKHTATIIKKGYDYDRASRWSQIRYKGTRYYLLGSTFEFEAGETATVYLGLYSSGQITINVNGVAVVDTTASGYQYSYTLPDADISIELGDATAPETINIYEVTSVVVKPLNAIANGSYSETGIAYSPVTVAVEADVDETLDVIFVDYDGTPKYSYSASDFSALTTMPANPSHDGLTAQGWNWSLSDAKAYVTKYGKLVIGQMYITDDGNTRLYITIGKSYKTCAPTLATYSSGTITVDWGDDNTNTYSVSANGYAYTTHTYTNDGNYVITISSTAGYGLYGWSGYGNLLTANLALSDYAPRCCPMLTKVELGARVRMFGRASCFNSSNLESVTLPEGTVFRTTDNARNFSNCYKLKGLVIPSGANESFDLGTQFAINSGIEYISFPSTYVSAIDTYAFASTFKLKRLTLPESITSIPSDMCYNGSGVSTLIIPDTITSIGTDVFTKNNSIRSVTIPASVTSIGQIFGSQVYGLAEIHLLASTPPTASSTIIYKDASLPSDFRIYVPYSADHSILNAYKSATNWSALASYIVEEPT